MPTIAVIVEGRGEVEAVPILIRKIAEVEALGVFPDVRRPIRMERARRSAASFRKMWRAVTELLR